MEIFQSVHFIFLDVADHLWNNPGTVEDSEATVPPGSTGKDHSKWSIISGVGDMFSAIFRGGSSGGYSKATINKIKEKCTDFA